MCMKTKCITMARYRHPVIPSGCVLSNIPALSTRGAAVGPPVPLRGLTDSFTAPRDPDVPVRVVSVNLVRVVEDCYSRRLTVFRQMNRKTRRKKACHKTILDMAANNSPAGMLTDTGRPQPARHLLHSGNVHSHESGYCVYRDKGCGHGR